MMAIDWTLLGLGALAGALASALFFAGLAWGMRLSLRARHPLPILLVSATIRIAALLAVGWLVAERGAAALAGFALAFLVVRFAIVALARPHSAHEAT